MVPPVSGLLQLLPPRPRVFVDEGGARIAGGESADVLLHQNPRRRSLLVAVPPRLPSGAGTIASDLFRLLQVSWAAACLTTGLSGETGVRSLGWWKS